MPQITITGARTKENLCTYLNTDVYTEAKARIQKILDLYDTVVVAFSGGKDSLVVLHLLKEVYDERGITTPVNVIFRDEELIPDCVIEFMDKYRQLPWVKLLWFAVPLKSNKYILGKTYDYVQWDRDRPWVREKPDWSIKDDAVVYDQYTMDAKIAEYFPGKICVLTGIRASESLVRLRAIVNKINETVVANTQCKRVNLGRPIYDWEEDDVFQYFYEKKIKYCSIYDVQHVNGENLRVSTPIHAEASKRLTALRSRDPLFYERLLKVFPEIAVQERYFKDVDVYAAMGQYPMTLEGILQYIDDNITDYEQNELAHDRYRSVMHRHSYMPDSYPLEHIFKAFISGAYKRQIMPAPRKKK